MLKEIIGGAILMFLLGFFTGGSYLDYLARNARYELIDYYKTRDSMRQEIRNLEILNRTDTFEYNIKKYELEKLKCPSN